MTEPPPHDEREDLRVLHVFRSPVGGLFRYVVDQVREQSRGGLQVGLLCDSITGGSHADGVLDDLATDCGLGIHRDRIGRKPDLGDVRVLGHLRRICDTIAPHLLHGHGAKGGAYARIVARRFGARAVCTPHGGALHYSYTSPSGAVYLLLERMLRRRTDGMIFESEFAREAYVDKVGSPSFPVRVIHNGLRDDEFTQTSDIATASDHDFVFVGEIRKLKGIDVLLEAVKLARQRCDITLLIVGSGPDEARLRARINKLDLDDSITLSPPVHPAAAAFRRGRCVIVPSLAESFPYLVLETLAAGMPLLATRVGGIPEIFGGYSDQLLAPGDPSSLAAAMLAVREDPESALSRARALHEHVAARFRAARMVEETIAFYRQLAGHTGPVPVSGRSDRSPVSPGTR